VLVGTERDSGAIFGILITCDHVDRRASRLVLAVAVVLVGVEHESGTIAIFIACDRVDCGAGRLAGASFVVVVAVVAHASCSIVGLRIASLPAWL
jgi:hypothetical protein